MMALVDRDAANERLRHGDAEQMEARWRGKTDTGAIAEVSVPNGTYQVSVAVDGDGSLRALDAERWGDPDGSLGLHSFGGAVEAGSFGGTTTTTAAGRIGRHAGTGRHAQGEFFLYRITSARIRTAL